MSQRKLKAYIQPSKTSEHLKFQLQLFGLEEVSTPVTACLTDVKEAATDLDGQAKQASAFVERCASTVCDPQGEWHADNLPQIMVLEPSLFPAATKKPAFRTGRGVSCCADSGQSGLRPQPVEIARLTQNIPACRVGLRPGGSQYADPTGGRLVAGDTSPVRKKTTFRTLLQLASPTHRHVLRKAADLMEAGTLTPARLVALGMEERERRLRALDVGNATNVARRIPAALAHLAAMFPDEGLPVVVLKPSRHHPFPRRRDEPRRFRVEIVLAYKALKHARVTAGADGHKRLTDWTILRSAREYRAASERAGIAMSNDLGLEALTYEYLALATIDCLRRSYTLTTVGKILGGVIAVARLVLGPDHAHLAWLETQRRSRSNQPSRGLPHATELKLAGILTNGGVQRLLQVPEQLEASSQAPGLGRKDEVGRLQFALLLQLKLDHPGLSESQAAALDLEQDIERNNGGLFLRLWPAWKEGPSVNEPMSAEACRLMHVLAAARKRTGLESPRLFPTRAEVFSNDLTNTPNNLSPRKRRTGAVMISLYSEINRHADLQLTFQDIKDLITVVLLESHVDPFVVARRAGYRNTRSMEVRMQARYDAGLVR